MSLRWLILLTVVLMLVVVGGVALLIADQRSTPEGCLDPPECYTIAIPEYDAGP